MLRVERVPARLSNLRNYNRDFLQSFAERVCLDNLSDAASSSKLTCIIRISYYSHLTFRRYDRLVLESGGFL